MVRAKLNIGCRYSTPVRERPLHPTRRHFTPEASQTQAPVTPATEPERRSGGSLTTGDLAEGVEIRVIGEPAAEMSEKRVKVERLFLGKREYVLRLIPLLPVRLDIDLRNATVSAGGLRKSQRSPCLIRAFQQWEGTQHHALPEPRG